MDGGLGESDPEEFLANCSSLVILDLGH